MHLPKCLLVIFIDMWRWHIFTIFQSASAHSMSFLIFFFFLTFHFQFFSPSLSYCSLNRWKLLQITSFDQLIMGAVGHACLIRLYNLKIPVRFLLSMSLAICQTGSNLENHAFAIVCSHLCTYISLCLL